MPSSRAPSQPREGTQVSCIAGGSKCAETSHRRRKQGVSVDTLQEHFDFQPLDLGVSDALSQKTFCETTSIGDRNH